MTDNEQYKSEMKYNKYDSKKTVNDFCVKHFKSPIYNGSTLWNSLRRNIQDSDTYKQFKFRFKQYLN